MMAMLIGYWDSKLSSSFVVGDLSVMSCHVMSIVFGFQIADGES